MKQQLRKLWLLALCALMSVASAWATDQTVITQEELNSAINSASDLAVITINQAGTYTLPNEIKNSITIQAADNVSVKVVHTTNAAITTITTGKTATFKNITFELGTEALATAHGFGTLNGDNGAVVMTNCTINGALNLFGVSMFIGCKFNASGIYNIWAINDKATFEGCEFTNTNRAVNVYDQKHGTETKEVIFSNCTFKSTGSEKKKAAINIHHNPDNQTAGAKFDVSISDNCSTSGVNWAGTVAETGEPAGSTICYSPLWMISDIKNWADGDITITLGNDVQNLIVAQIGEAYYATLPAAVEAAADGETIKIIKAGKYDIPAITKSLTIEAAEGDNGVVVEHITNAAITTIASGKTATFKNITFDLGTTVALATAHGFGTLNGNNGTLAMDNCTINGALNLFGKSTFTGCKFNASGIYNIWAVNDDATFTGCTFENTNRAVNVYDQKHGTTSDKKVTVSFSNCTFNSTGTEKKKAAINIHHYPDNSQTAGAKFNVTITGCQTTGDNWAANVAETGEPGGATICYSPLWMISDIVNWADGDITVTKDNVSQNVSISTFVAQIGEAYYPTLPAAVEAATEGATIKIIKADNYDIPAITKNLTIEAADNVSVTVEHTTNAAITTIATGKTATFKNITFNLGDVQLATAHGFGTLNGNNGELKMEGCTIIGALNLFGVSTFTNCTFSASGIYNIWAVNDNATFTNCEFTNTNRAVNVYDQKHGSTSKTVSFSGCTFTGSAKKKAAINIHHNPDKLAAGAKFNVTISDDCKTEGTWAASVAETGEPAAATICYSSLWMISDIKNWKNDDIKVTVGTDVQNFSVAQIGQAKYPTLQEAFNVGGEVTLLNNITLSEAANIPSGKEVTLNLNGTTIIGPTADYAIIVEGTLTVNGDGSAINATSNTADKGVFFVKNGQLTINSGTFTAASDVAVITIDDENDASQIEVSGGTFSSNVNEFVKEGYMAIQEQDGESTVYKVYTRTTSTTTDTTTEHTEEITVKDGESTKQTITVSVKPTSTTTSAGNVALNQVDLSDVIQDVINTTDLGTDPTINVSVELQVNATTKSSDTTGENKKITFEVKPQAVVTVNSTAKDPVDISNDQLTAGAKFAFTLVVTDLGVDAGGQVKVVHKSSDSGIYPDETFMAVVTEKESKKYVTINTTHFSEFEVSNSTVSSTDDVVLTDGEATPYNITTDTQVASATYVRSFGAERVDKYQAWLVPFDYTITAEDVSNFDFFKINMIANAPGESTPADADKLWIFLDPVTTGTTLYANMPYVFKPKNEQPNYQFKTTSATLKATTDAALVTTETVKNKYSFYATYNNTTATTVNPFYYVNTEGQICKGTTVTVGAYRWIIKVTDKSGFTYAPQLNLEFVEGDATSSQTTGIETRDAAKGVAENYYNLNGMEVKSPAKGIHIVKTANGEVRKVVVK